MSEEKRKTTVYLNIILKESEPVEMVQRCLDSAKDFVDGMYVTVTYSEKAPEKSALLTLLRKYGAHVSLFKWVKDFSAARNFAMDQVPRGPEIFIFWQDADDVLRGGEYLKPIAEEMFAQNIAATYFDYWYSVDLDKEGNVREVIINHKRERIIRNDDTFMWIGALHETLIKQRQENVIMVSRKECTIVHLTQSERLDKNIDRNIEILEASAERENHKDPRTLVYLAKAYFDKCKMLEGDDRKAYMDLALRLFHEYLRGSGEIGSQSYQEQSGWAEERATAWGCVAEIAILSDHPEVAIQAYESAIDEAPQFPNYYVDLALTYTLMGDFKKARHWLNVATSIPSPETTIITFPRELKSRALEVSYHINFHEQKLDWALQDAQKLLQIFPDSQDAKERVEIASSLKAYNTACQSVVYLGKYLEQIKETDKISNLIGAMPTDMRREKFAAEMRHLFLPPRTWGENEIAIVCGPGFEYWSPKSLNTGIGGSETAVICMSQELTKLGWKVTVFGNPGKDAGVYDGVEYCSWHEINPKDNFNVLVLWRSIGMVDINPKAKFTLLWLHDVPENADFTEERINKIDKIAVLSEYHKSLLRLAKGGIFEPMPEEKVFLTSNGIANLPLREWCGNPRRMIYSSSPDRGLVYLLKMWPEIKKQVPDAELHTFYGFKVFDAIHAGNPARMAWKEQLLKLMKQDGIHYHDRIGKEDLYKEFNQSGIWAYPTDFTEISCITAMEAQTLGAIPVCTTVGALDETVKNGIKVDVDTTTQEGQKEYLSALVDLLQHPEKQEEIRKTMMPWAHDYFLWSNVAALWDEKLRIELQSPSKFNAESEALRLILADEPLEALKLLEVDSPLKQKLVKKLDHIFNYKKYQEKYAEDPMNWKAEDAWYDRYDWVLKQAKDAKTLIDLGCYEGHLVDKFGKGAKGVEICKAAADEKRNIVTGDALTYQDGKKYDAVVACEIIEHVPDPKVLIDNMLSLVSDNGWCYLTTPNGCYDPENTLKSWNNPNDLIDHIRTFDKEKIETLLAGCNVEVAVVGKELYVKFRKK